MGCLRRPLLAAVSTSHPSEGCSVPESSRGLIEHMSNAISAKSHGFLTIRFWFAWLVKGSARTHYPKVHLLYTDPPDPPSSTLLAPP